MNILPFPTPPETSFELLEMSCLNYLGDVATPIVSVDTLLEFCHRTPALAHISSDTLLTFLRGHEDVEVLEGPTPEEQISAELMGEVGLFMGPRAVLKKRIPTQRELHAHMAVQLQAMKDALSQALAVAGPGEQLAEKRESIEIALGKIDDLMVRLSTMLR